MIYFSCQQAKKPPKKLENQKKAKVKKEKERKERKERELKEKKARRSEEKLRARSVTGNRRPHANLSRTELNIKGYRSQCFLFLRSKPEKPKRRPERLPEKKVEKKKGQPHTLSPYTAAEDQILSIETKQIVLCCSSVK